MARLVAESQRLITLDSSSIMMDRSPMPESLLLVARLVEQRNKSDITERIEPNTRVFCRIFTPIA